MSCIVYTINKKTNTKYAYRSESYRDPVTKKPKSRRTYLGRVDPVTNEIIPKAEKGKRNRSPIGANSRKPDEAQGQDRIDPNKLKEGIKLLQKKMDGLKAAVLDIDNAISSINSLVSKM